MGKLHRATAVACDVIESLAHCLAQMGSFGTADSRVKIGGRVIKKSSK